MARDVNIRMTFGEEIADERDAAEIFAEMGMNCDGVIAVTCTVGRERFTQADLHESFWESRCVRSDLNMHEEGAPDA